MANTLTDLIPDLYASLDVVSRELVGFIPSVTLDPSTARAAVGQEVVSPVAPTMAAQDIEAGSLFPDAGDVSYGNVKTSIKKSRMVPMRWNGEEELSVSQSTTSIALRRDSMQQAMRTLVNEMESDLALLHVGASRAHGTAGSTPFGTAGNFTDASFTRKILVDNGAGESELKLVLDTAAGANIRGFQSKANEAGTDTLLRQGVLLDINGMEIRESAQVKTNTAGTGASATTNAAGYAIGATVITLAAVGTGTIVAGDVITFAGDDNQYVVASGDTNVADAGTITLSAPGLRQAIGAEATAITVVAAAARNMAFRRSAIVLAQRMPALPQGGDGAIDRATITDPRSGITFEVAMYPGFRRMNYMIGASWGANMVKPEHTALLLG